MKNHLENKGACGVALQFCNSVLNSRAERVFDISSHFKNHKGAKSTFEVALQFQNFNEVFSLKTMFTIRNLITVLV